MKFRSDFTKLNLKKAGFKGFITFRDLWNGQIDNISENGGAYVVLREIDTPPMFLEKNPGGRFKGKNPTVAKEKLQSNWVDGAHIIYIGKAEQLQRRIQQYLDFGLGNPVGHWGGRFIWQIENSDNFIIAWKLVEAGQEAKDLESELLEEFVKSYGRLPFANLRP